jgi:hypothetical protein
VAANKEIEFMKRKSRPAKPGGFCFYRALRKARRRQAMARLRERRCHSHRQEKNAQQPVE